MKKFWNWIHDDSGGRVLRLEGPIDSESFWGDEITPADFRAELESEEGDVTVWINSPGGNVFAAAEIYTMLKDYKSQVTVKIASIAASAASVIAMAGDQVLMSPTALLMIHDPSTIAMGNAKAMEQAITTLNEVKESIINAYAAKSGQRRSKIADLMIEKTVKIGDTDVKFRSSASVPRLYRIKFGRDIFKDLSRLEKSYKEKGGEEASAMEIEDLEIFENVAYIMAFHADPTIPKTIDEWLEQFEMFSIYEILPEILELWGTNLITDVEAKKNLKKAAGR